MTLHYVCKPCALTCQLCVGFGALESLCMALCVLWLLELTGCGAAVAALSSHAGRHQRALPDKRARRKPGWLDGTIDPKTAAQLAIQHTTGIEVRCLCSCHCIDIGYLHKAPCRQAKPSCLVGVGFSPAS